MKNKILIAVTLFVCTVASSCNNWLDEPRKLRSMPTSCFLLWKGTKVPCMVFIRP